MIENQVKQRLIHKFGGEDKVKLREVSSETGLTYVTVLNWWRGMPDRVDFKTLAAWCKYLECGVGDLLIYKAG